jgi:hypothetical protein
MFLLLLREEEDVGKEMDVDVLAGPPFPIRSSFLHFHPFSLDLRIGRTFDAFVVCFRVWHIL